MTTTTTVIGRTEMIDILKHPIHGIPAKVDTGADTCSIWATKIREENGTLKFVLFGPESHLYTGEVLKTRDYQMITVKNSFGHKQVRYKIYLKVRIAGKLINVRFTLANRKNNTFPVLIGRKTLKGKFLVDVAKPASGVLKEVLLLANQKTPKLLKFAENLQTGGKKVKVTVATYDELEFNLGQPASHITITSLNRDIASYNLVYFKAISRQGDVAAAIARYLQKRATNFLDQEVANYHPDSKLYQYVVATNYELAIPRSIFVMPTVLKNTYDRFVDVLGLPFVLKDIHSNNGNNNFLIKDKKDFNKAVKLAAKVDSYLIGQEFIPNDGDYRLIVLGGRVSLVIFRQSSGRSHLNNTSKGGTARLVEINDIPGNIRKSAVMAAALLNRQVAGVDMVQDKKTGSWYCLEVNSGPQLYSGSFVEQKQAAFTEYLKRVSAK